MFNILVKKVRVRSIKLQVAIVTLPHAHPPHAVLKLKLL